jgi:hypothetical protein
MAANFDAAPNGAWSDLSGQVYKQVAPNGALIRRYGDRRFNRADGSCT